MKTAEIIDFVTLPSKSISLNDSVRALVQSEINRVLEFGDDSLNNEEARVLAEMLTSEFNLGSHD